MACSNGGTCTTISGGAGWICSCPSGFTGDRCQNMIISQCASQPCRNNSTCTDGPFTYNCQCSYPFSGRQCQFVSTGQSPCDRNPCLNSGKCYPVGNSFTCACPLGYSGQTCETSIRPATCTINCSPGYCFSNPSTQPPYACYCPDHTIQLKSCTT
ncbi:unnamed protein product [Rotaria sp. Silwood2]|nr:unnamed protein product [Rotaria sp. Silwood2]CAF3935919.1 unnamed protein product [Rotaria sp. Silwood2]CAF4063461.1 unnamed protein product [Rotaria sp. Silwood2]